MNAQQLAVELIAYAEDCEERAKAARLAAELISPIPGTPVKNPMTQAQKRKK